MRALTEKQGRVLGFVRESIAKRGYPPTLREIAVHFGIGSTNGVNDHLIALERKGYIERSEMLSRGIRVVGDTSADPLPSDPKNAVRRAIAHLSPSERCAILTELLIEMSPRRVA